MSRRRGTSTNDLAAAQPSRAVLQRRRRRRRIVRGIGRVLIWTLVVGAVFIFGIGFGRTISSDEGSTNAPKVTLENDRGTVTATLPTTTITDTKTVTVTKTTTAKKTTGQ